MSGALDVHLDDGQRALLREAADLARDVLAPIAAEGEPGRVNPALLGAMAEHGLLERLLARDAGSAMDLCLIREGLARHCTEAETAFAVQGLGSFPILQSGARSSPALAARGSSPARRSPRSR